MRICCIHVYYWYMWDPSRSHFTCDLAFSLCLDLYCSLVWPHYFLFPCFSFRRILVFLLSYWLFAISCTMWSSPRLDFTCDHLAPVCYNIRTFYSDWWWPKIESDRIVYVSTKTVNYSIALSTLI